MSIRGLEAKVNLSQNSMFYHLLTRYNGWPISLRRLLYGDELLSLNPVEAITDLFKLFPSLFSAWKDPYYLGRSCLRSNPKHGGSWNYHIVHYYILTLIFRSVIYYFTYYIFQCLHSHISNQLKTFDRHHWPEWSTRTKLNTYHDLIHNNNVIDIFVFINIVNSSFQNFTNANNQVRKNRKFLLHFYIQTSFYIQLFQ